MKKAIVITASTEAEAEKILFDAVNEHVKTKRQIINGKEQFSKKIVINTDFVIS